ncbi:MAG TPA: trypsin-like peptidase domain-containing protein [Jatrophihabitantaceae bacterium]|nr:trypsin-like peptidase domain-containing protein [Jatrophihabitantaceae bacterium]
MRRVLLVLTAVLVLLGLGSTAAIADPPAPPGTPTASTFDGTPTVGPLFFAGLSAPHGCTASVLASPTRDLIITAAHCIDGTAAGVQFVPGYDRGATPYGVWTVTSAYVDPAWIATQDPTRDYAILRVSKHGRTGVQDVTGGSLLGVAPRAGERITDVAYNAGIDDQPITCSPRTYVTTGYPAFNCHGYVGGSSGSPWLTRLPGLPLTVVRGVIGGLHQGGCFEYTSYSSPFDAAVFRLLLRAVVGARPDVVPPAGSDGC